MNKRRMKLISVLMIFFMLFSITSLFAEAKEEFNNEKSTIDTMTNYDVKLRIIKDVYGSIKEDRDAGRKIDWNKAKNKVWKKHIAAQAGVELGLTGLGTGIQYALMGAFPPYGTIIGSFANSVLGSFGGAMGYETSKSMQSAKKTNVYMVLGNAIKNIDAAEFTGRTVGGMIGSVLGSMLPVPLVGTFVGGMIGSFIGGTVVSYLKRFKIVKKGCDKLQRIWNKGGEKLVKIGEKKMRRKEMKSKKISLSTSSSSSKLKDSRERYRSLYKKYTSLLKSKNIDSSKLKTTLNELNISKREYESLRKK